MTGSVLLPRSTTSRRSVGLCLTLVILTMSGVARTGRAQWDKNLTGASDAYGIAHDNSFVRYETGLIFGEQPGFEPGFYRFGAFGNLLESPVNLLFVDVHGISNYDNGTLSGEFGIGHRAYDENSGAVIGANAYYNHRQYENGPFEHGFHAYGFGLEYLTDTWGLRGNVYLSASGRRSNGGSTALQTPTYVGNNIRLGARSENFDEAMQGIDVEISRKLPEWGPWGSEVGVGLYHLQAQGGARNHAWGPQLRGDFWVTENLTVFANYSYDRVFNHSFNGGFVVHLGGPDISAAGRAASGRSRLWARVQRRHTVPVVNYTDGVPDLLAHDAISGELITITHVDGTTAPGGDGTTEMPYQTLTDASLSGTGIVLVQPDVYNGDSIVMSDNQRLLAASKLHTVDTQELGLIDLPGTGLGGTTAIVASPGDAITIGNNAEVRGFLIANAAGQGIVGRNVTGYDINCNTLLNGGQNGILIDMQPGSGPTQGRIWDNTVSLHGTPGTAGILVANPGDAASVQIYENVVDSNAAGIIVAADSLDGDIYDNVAINSQFGPGIGVFVNTHDGDVINNVASGNAAQGILISTNAVPNTLNVVGNQANGNGEDGIVVDILGDGPGVDLNIRQNNTNGNGRHGINVESQGNQDLNGTVANNIASGNAGFGVFLNTNTAQGTGSINAEITGNVANANGLSGVAASSATDVTGDVFGNIAQGNGDFGVWVSAAQDVASDAINNTANGNGDSGIRVAAARDMLGNVVDNRAAANGGAGIELTAGRDVIGDLALNEVVDNSGPGIGYNVGRDFVGDVVGNVAEGTIGGEGLNLQVGGGYFGNLLGNAATGNAGDGLRLDAAFIEAGVGDPLAAGNSLDGNLGSGLVLISNTDLIGDVVANIATNNGASGVHIQVAETALSTLAGNVADDNALGGVVILATDYAGDIVDNTALGNGADGIAIVTTGDISTLVINNNTSDNGDFGLTLEADGDFTGNVVQNIAVNNGGAGIYVETDNIAPLIGSVLAENNSTVGNGRSGLVFIADTNLNGDIVNNETFSNGFSGPSNGMTLIAGGTYTGTLMDNIANDNALDGVGMTVISFVGDVFANTAFGNGANGIRMTVGGPFTGNIVGNETSFNGNDGFHLSVANNFTGDFVFNTAEVNTVYGFNTTAGGTVSGIVSPNSASGNGTADFNGNIATP